MFSCWISRKKKSVSNKFSFRLARFSFLRSATKKTQLRRDFLGRFAAAHFFSILNNLSSFLLCDVFFSWKIFFFFFSPWGKFFPLLIFASALSANFTRKFLLFFQVFIFFRNFSNFFFIIFFSRIFPLTIIFSWFTLFSLSHTARFSSDVLHASNKTPRSTEAENLLENIRKIFISLKTQPTTFFEGFNPRRRGRWMSQRSWYCSTIDQKKNTDQQNTENVNEAQEPGEKSKRNIRKRNFRICSPLSRAHTALILNARLYMKKFLIFFLSFLLLRCHTVNVVK